MTKDAAHRCAIELMTELVRALKVALSPNKLRP